MIYANTAISVDENTIELIMYTERHKNVIIKKSQTHNHIQKDKYTQSFTYTHVQTHAQKYSQTKLSLLKRNNTVHVQHH